MTTRLLVFFSGFVLALLTSLAAADSPCDSSLLPTGFEKVFSSARERVTKGELPSVAIVVAQHRKIVCEEAIGWADRDKQIPATPNTVYAAGSVAKAFTGTATFILVQKGKIRLDDAPEKYGVHVHEYAGMGITIRQLLTMTAGIQHGWFYDYGAHLSGDELLDHYAISAFPPGKHYIYSNFSFGILGHVVEHAAKRPFPDFVGSELLNPLHMNSSGFDPAPLHPAVGYQEGKAVPPHTFQPNAAGGFYTSAHDLALFGLFQMNSAQGFVAPELMKQMHAPETDQQKWYTAGLNMLRFKDGSESRYMGGWGTFNFKDGSVVLITDGRVLAGSATLLILPKSGVAIACLTNRATGAMDDLAFQLANLFSNGVLAELQSAFNEIDERETAQPYHAQASQVGSWAGIVQTPEGPLRVKAQITRDDHMQIGFGEGAMVPVANLGIEQGFLSGEVPTSLTLPETAHEPSKLNLQLLWEDGNHLIGTVRAESTGDLPRFGLPLYISLSKQK